MKSEDKRVFLAIPAPPEIISLQNNLRKSNSHIQKIKWTRNQNLHLTFYFIGNIAKENSEVLIEKIKPVISKQKNFTLNFESLAFAPSKKPRMLWVKFFKNEFFTNFSNEIHNELSELLQENKFHFKEPTPHITMARFHSLKNYSDIELTPKEFETISGLKETKINSCELWETVKTESRSDYRSVLKFPFEKSV